MTSKSAVTPTKAFKNRFTSILEMYKKAGFIKNKPNELSDIVIDIIDIMYPTNLSKRKQIYNDLCYSVYKIKMNGALVFILDTKNKNIIKNYFSSKKLPPTLESRIRRYHQKIKESSKENIQEYCQPSIDNSCLNNASKVVLGISIPKKINNNDLLKLLTKAIIQKGNKKQKPKVTSPKYKKLKIIPVLGEGSGKIIDVDNYMKRISNKTFDRKEVKLSSKKPKLTKYSK